MSVDELKQRQGAVWGSGPFERIDPRLGERMLDLVCGKGRVAELAAGRGAAVEIDYQLAVRR